MPRHIGSAGPTQEQVQFMSGLALEALEIRAHRLTWYEAV